MCELSTTVGVVYGYKCVSHADTHTGLVCVFCMCVRVYAQHKGGRCVAQSSQCVCRTCRAVCEPKVTRQQFGLLTLMMRLWLNFCARVLECRQ